MPQEGLREKVGRLPAKPGVYLFRDAAGQVIYVGKSVNLRERVRSYVQPSTQAVSPKVRELIERAVDVEFIVTATELEALVLECNLIKEYRPRYNVRLKDDKRYPYIKVTWQEPFPRVLVTRRLQQDGARYYGPYTSVAAVHQTLDLLRRLFPFRTCHREITGKDRRACLYYHIGRCLGPCIGAVGEEEYRGVVEQVCRFLEGYVEEITADLRRKMEEAAEALEFERAAVYRDQLRAVELLSEQQRVASLARADQDVIAFARDDGEACVQVFFIRNGQLIGREYFVLEGTEGEDDREVLAAFLEQFYAQAAYVPPEVIVPADVDRARVIEAWLRDRRGGDRVMLTVPREGVKADLLRMAAENAAETLAALREEWAHEQTRYTEALSELQEVLELPTPPSRIEGYDISTLHGMATVGSMVVFVQGVPRKSAYRRFRVRTVEGIDDFAAMQEVLERRFRHMLEEVEEQKADEAFHVLPDLIVVDGGKGQLNVAVAVLRELGLDELAVCGLAKREEEVFVPGRSDPIRLPGDSPALHLLQRVRDEAHRFAVRYHRRVRERGGMASLLEQVPGIGPRRRRALLEAFGSIEAIRKASVEELAAVPGMTWKAAQALKDWL